MTYNPGDKIFAKVRGYPHWPCRINPLPKDVVVPKSKYPIFFYGTHEVYFLAKKDIFPYEKNKEKYGKRSTKAFQEGMDEIETNPDILLYGKDPQAEEFLLQFYDFECKSKLKTPDTSADFDTDNKITENPAKEPEEPAEASEPKCPDDVLDKTPVGVHEKTNSPEKELKETVENSEQKQVETSEQEQVETSEQKQVETSEPKPVEDSPDEPVAALDQKLIETSKPKQTKISQPKPVKAVVEEKPKKLNALGRPIRKSASNFSAKKMVLGDDFVSSDDSDFNPLEHQPKKEDDEETTKEKEEKVLSPKKDVPKKIAEATTDAIPPPKKKPKVTSPKSPPIKKVKPFKKTPSVIKEPKMATTETTPLPVKDNQNHLNESKNLENETKLMILDRGIKSCLVLNQENFSACLLHMKNLETLQPSLLSLAKCYSIVLTIKKCRRYNRSSEIKLIAQQIFNNFLEIFTKSSKNEITEADREFQRRIDSVIKTGKGKDLPKCISELFSFQKLVSTPSIKKDTNDQQPNESSTILSSPPVPTENVANPVSPSPTKLSNVNSSSRPANSSAENKSESILMSGGNVMEAIKKAFIRQVVTKTLEDETQVNQEGASTNDLKNGAHETSCEADVPDNKSEDVKSPPNQNDSLNQMSSSPEVNQKSSTTKDSNSNTPKEEFHRPPSPLDVELMPKSPKTPSFEDCINPEPTQLEQMEMISNAKSVNVKVDRKRDRSPHALPHPIKHYKQCFLQALGVDPKTKDDQKKNHRDEAEKRTTPKALTNDPFTTPSPKIEKVEENDSPQKDYLDLDSRIANLFQISKKSDENSPVETGLKEIEKQPVENNLPPPPPPLQTSNIVLKARPQVTQGKTQNGFEYPPVDHRYQHIPSVPITPDSPPRSNVTQSPNNILNLLSHGITPSRAQNEITPTSPPRTGGPTQSLNGLIGLLGQSKRVQPVEKCPSTPEDVEVDNGVPSPEPTPNEPAGAKENTEISSPDHLVEDTKNLNGSSEVTPQTANTAY